MLRKQKEKIGIRVQGFEDPRGQVKSWKIGDTNLAPPKVKK